MHFRFLDKNQMGSGSRVECGEVLEVLSQLQEDQNDVPRSESVVRLGQVDAVWTGIAHFGVIGEKALDIERGFGHEMWVWKAGIAKQRQSRQELIQLGIKI